MGKGIECKVRERSIVILDINTICHLSGSFSFSVFIKHDIPLILYETALRECAIERPECTL
jgi:hypothetical protein